MAINKFVHISVCVSNMERSLRFYRDILGFRVMAEFDFEGPDVSKVMGLKDAKFKGVFMKRDGLNMELIAFQRPSGRPFPASHRSNDVGFSHVTFTVDDIEETIRDLKAKGVQVLDETRGATNGIPVCQLKDPDGMLIEVYQASPGSPTPYDQR